MSEKSEVWRVDPKRFAIEIRCDGQVVRFEGPTIEEVIQLENAYSRCGRCADIKSAEVEN